VTSLVLVIQIDWTPSPQPAMPPPTPMSPVSPQSPTHEIAPLIATMPRWMKGDSVAEALIASRATEFPNEVLIPIARVRSLATERAILLSIEAHDARVTSESSSTDRPSESCGPPRLAWARVRSPRRARERLASTLEASPLFESAMDASMMPAQAISVFSATVGSLDIAPVRSKPPDSAQLDLREMPPSPLMSLATPRCLARARMRSVLIDPARLVSTPPDS
jgi:hypothetical protein